MEREVRDVVNALAGCVAMRCAAEKNLDEVANVEVGGLLGWTKRS